MPLTLPNPPAQVDCAIQDRATSHKWDVAAPLRFWHLTSLDAPTVAVVWSLAFAWAAKIRLPIWIPVLLALAAWSIYIADRLLDTRAALRTGNLQGLRQRHWFHHQHRGLLGPLAIAFACAAACIVLREMPLAARERNSVLAVAALAYFARVHASRWLPGAGSFGRVPRFNKELLVGLLFTAACVLPALSRVFAQRNEPIWPPMAVAGFFAMLAWLNCHAIERWETNASRRAEEVFFSEAKASVPSATFMRGLKPPAPSGSSFTAAGILAVAGLLLAGVLSCPQPRAAVLVASGTASAVLLGLLDYFRDRLTPLALRVSADLVLLTPIALLTPLALLIR